MEKILFASVYEKEFPFWKELSPEDQADLCRSSTAVSYPRGATIHDSTDCTGLILVQTGCLRVYMLSEEGKEITLYRLFPGEMCMLSASCVLQSITFDVIVDAEENSTCYILSGSAYDRVARRNPEMKIFALEGAVSRFSDVMWVMQQILFMSMDRRLAIFLQDETAKSGSDTVKLTHEQIAKYMGSAREVVSRMLKYFSAEGIVQVSRGGIRILDRQKLRALAL